MWVESIDHIAAAAAYSVHWYADSYGGVSRRCTLTPLGIGDPPSQLQPFFCTCSFCKIPAFCLKRGSLFISLGALSFLLRLICSLPLVRKGLEHQNHSPLLPSPHHFFGV